MCKEIYCLHLHPAPKTDVFYTGSNTLGHVLFTKHLSVGRSQMLHKLLLTNLYQSDNLKYDIELFIKDFTRLHKHSVFLC